MIEVALAKAANARDLKAAQGIPSETLLVTGMAIFAVLATFFSRPKMPEMKIHLFHHNV